VKTEKMELITKDDLKAKIFTIRGIQVMLDRDLALLYGVQTKVLNQAVKRNKERFPESFCFQLNKIEFTNWKSQIVTSNSEKMGLRHTSFEGFAILRLTTTNSTKQKTFHNFHYFS
jgi:hypothetical protein